MADSPLPINVQTDNPPTAEELENEIESDTDTNDKDFGSTNTVNESKMATKEEIEMELIHNTDSNGSNRSLLTASRCTSVHSTPHSPSDEGMVELPRDGTERPTLPALPEISAETPGDGTERPTPPVPTISEPQRRVEDLRQDRETLRDQVSNEPLLEKIRIILGLSFVRICIALISIALGLFDLISDWKFCYALSAVNGMETYSLSSYIILFFTTCVSIVGDIFMPIYVVYKNTKQSYSLPPGSQMLAKICGVLIEDLLCSVLMLLIILQCQNCGFVLSMIHETTTTLTLKSTILGSAWKAGMLGSSAYEWITTESPESTQPDQNDRTSPEPNKRNEKRSKMVRSVLAILGSIIPIILAAVSLVLVSRPGLLASVSGCTEFTLRVGTKTVYPIGQGGCTTNGSATIEYYSMETAINETFKGVDVLTSNQMRISVPCNRLLELEVFGDAGSPNSSRCEMIVTASYSPVDWEPEFRIGILIDSEKLLQGCTKPGNNTILTDPYWSSSDAIGRVLRSYCGSEQNISTHQCSPIVNHQSPALPCFDCARACYSWSPIDFPNPSIVFDHFEAQLILGSTCRSHPLKWKASPLCG